MKKHYLLVPLIISCIIFFASCTTTKTATTFSRDYYTQYIAKTYSFENQHNITKEKTVKPILKDEIFLFFKGYLPKKAKKGNIRIDVYLDKKFVGTSTLKDGFSITINNTKPGRHKLLFMYNSIYHSRYKINTKKKNVFEFNAKKSWPSYYLVPIKK